MSEANQSNAPAPAAPPAPAPTREERGINALTEALRKEGLVKDPPPAEPAATPAPAASAPPPAPPAQPEIPALAKVAKAQAELRKEREQVEPYLGMFKQFSPQEAQRLAQARASGSAVAALKALGFSHEQYSAELIAASAAARAAPAQTPGTPPAAPAPAPVDEGLKKELEELRSFKQTYEQEKLQGARKQFLASAESLVKADPKFPLLAKLGEVERIERLLIDHQRQYGSLPGDTIEESIKMAAEVVEQELKKEADRWKGVLTPAAEPAPVATKAPESTPVTGSEANRTITNGNSTAPAVRASVSREDRVKKLLADPNFNFG